jgi:hypothetical protein
MSTKQENETPEENSVGEAAGASNSEQDETIPNQTTAAQGFTLVQKVYKLRKSSTAMSPFWRYFHTYDVKKHPEKEHNANCNLCGKDLNIKNGVVGLKRHIQNKHVSVHDFVEGNHNDNDNDNDNNNNNNKRKREDPKYDAGAHKKKRLQQRLKNRYARNPKPEYKITLLNCKILVSLRERYWKINPLLLI